MLGHRDHSLSKSREIVSVRQTTFCLRSVCYLRLFMFFNLSYPRNLVASFTFFQKRISGIRDSFKSIPKVLALISNVPM